MRISDWSSDVCSSDLLARAANKTLVVAAFFVEREIAGKEHDLPGRAQRGTARAVGEFDGRTLHSRGRHLARQRALPDQVIEPRVIGRPGAKIAERRGGKEWVSTCRFRWSPDH